MPFALALACAFGLAACQQPVGADAMTVAALQADFDANLPRGTPAQDIEAFLASKGLTHSGLIDNAGLAHMGFDPSHYELKSLVRGADKPALVRTDTSITFVFDREKKLLETRVTEVHTGP